MCTNIVLVMNLDIEFTVPRAKIHLHLVQLGSKCITIIEGLDKDEELDLKRIAKGMRKHFNCAATIKTTKDDDVIIQLQGDHREEISNWLVANDILTKSEASECIIVHGG